jgi:LytS/YehU family sensor histidine kinase
VTGVTLIAGYGNLKLELYLRNNSILLSREQHFRFFLSQLGMAARYLLISFLLKISVDYYEQKETLKKIELLKTTAELNFLKAQVNPHFLFNTLNNLYALILEKSDKSGEAVLKLADIMKYILAEGKEDKVPLQKEIELLYNYTELERLRKPDAEIIFASSGNTQPHVITPLLLLPLVENAFKYGLNSVSKNGFVRINITAGTGMVQVTVENNIPPVKNNEALKSLGLGIENVKQRLEILYAGKHAIHIDNKTESFIVNLQLQTV